MTEGALQSTRCSSRSGAIRRPRSSRRRRTPRPRSTSATSSEFWETEGRERITWFEPFDAALRVGSSLRQVVRRREAQRLLQLRRPPRRVGTRREGRLPLGGRAGGRAAHDHVRRPPARGRALRQRTQGARRRQGHAGRHLHGNDPGASGLDARVRAPRARRTRSSSAASAPTRSPTGSTTWSARF